jgi:hypothetical protein
MAAERSRRSSSIRSDMSPARQVVSPQPARLPSSAPPASRAVEIASPAGQTARSLAPSPERMMNHAAPSRLAAPRLSAESNAAAARNASGASGRRATEPSAAPISHEIHIYIGRTQTELPRSPPPAPRRPRPEPPPLQGKPRGGPEG